MVIGSIEVRTPTHMPSVTLELQFTIGQGPQHLLCWARGKSRWAERSTDRDIRPQNIRK